MLNGAKGDEMAINTQTVRIDLNTGKSMPTVFTHQNDNNRQVTFALYNNGVAYTPSSTTVKFGYVSPIVNGQYSVIAGNNMASGTVSGNTVTVTLPSTYTAVSGVGMLTMILTTSNNTLRPVNIKLVVQRSADGSDVVTGASDFPTTLEGIVEDWADDNKSSLATFCIPSVIESTNGWMDENADSLVETKTNNWLDENGEELLEAYVNPYIVSQASYDNEYKVATYKNVNNGEVFDLDLGDLTPPILDEIAIERELVTTTSDTVSQYLDREPLRDINNYVSKEYYDTTDGSVKTHTRGSRCIAYISVAPSSTISVDTQMIVSFYSLNKRFISAVTSTSAGQEFTVPSNAYFVRFSSKMWDGTTEEFSRNSRFAIAKTNVLVDGASYKSEVLHIGYEQVDDTEDVDAAVERVSAFDNAITVQSVTLSANKLIEVVDGRVYYQYPYPALRPENTMERTYIRFYDEDYNIIPVSDITIGTGVQIQKVYYSATGKQELTLHESVRVQFWFDDGVLHGKSGYNAETQATFATPVKYFMLFNNDEAFSVDNPFSTVLEDGSMYLTVPNKTLGFWEQVQSKITDFASVSDSEFVRKMKSLSIQETNKMRHAFRVATWNVYGASKNKTNWNSIKVELQKYGIDIVGFQEVKDPLGTSTDGVFSEAVASWQLQQFSDTALFPNNARVVATTGDFTFVQASETKYSTQSNYGDRYFVKAEFELPMWKHKHWSEHMRVSVYDTQLEVGTSDTNTATRLAQVQQLVTAMQADTNPFIILCGDFNEMRTDFSTWNAIRNAGYTPALADASTPTAYRGYYDNIFVNDRISVIETDVIPYSENGTNISDHDLVFADVLFDYSHIIGLKLGLVNCHVSNPTEWLDDRQTESVSFTVVADSGFTLGTISCGQGNNDLTYDNGAVTLNGNTVTIIPNLVVGDVWINCTATEST